MNLTNKFSLDKIKDILLVALKNVNNMELLKESVSKDVSEEYGEFAFSAGGEAGIQVQLFNDVDDDNNDELAAALEIDQEIKKEFAFLSYELWGKVKGGVKADLDYAALGLNKVNEISHKSYLKHQNSEPLAQAIAKDVTKFKIAFDWDSVTSLANYEAVSISSKSALDFSAEVSVSDTFTPLLSGISKILNANDAIGVKMDMNASLKVNVNIADFFQTIVQRRDDKDKKCYLINIRKESKSTKQATAALGVTAAISNPEVLMEAISKIIDRGEKGLGTEIEKLKGKAWNKLSDKEKALVEKGAKKIGINTEKPEEDLLKKYGAKRDEIIAKIKALVESELKFSVSFTYEKTKETQSLLKGTFSEEAFRRNFKNVLRLQVKEVYAYAKDKPNEIQITDYLDLTKISITWATKVGFSVADFELSQIVKKSVSFTDQITYDNKKNPEEIQFVNFSSSKFTAEKLGIFKERENSMSLSGSYIGEPKADIFMCNLDYSFALSWAENFKNPKDAQVRKVVDFASTWGIIEEKSFNEQLSTISDLLKGRKKVKVSAFLKMKEGDFDSLIDPILKLSDYTFQQALAASVPYADYDGRQNPSVRRDLYYSFFNLYLKQISGSDIDYTKVRDTIVKHLEHNGKTKLARFEEFGDSKYTPLHKLLEHNFMAFRFKNFQNAIELLNDSKKNFKSIITSARFLQDLNSVRLQPAFNMRFLGRLIWQLSVDKGIDKAVERSLTIEYKDDKDKDNKYVLAR
jgi:hypothetical protein